MKKTEKKKRKVRLPKKFHDPRLIRSPTKYHIEDYVKKYLALVVLPMFEQADGGISARMLENERKLIIRTAKKGIMADLDEAGSFRCDSCRRFKKNTWRSRECYSPPPPQSSFATPDFHSTTLCRQCF